MTKKTDEITKMHEKLKDDVWKEGASTDWWKSVMKNRLFKEFLSRLEEQITVLRKRLESQENKREEDVRIKAEIAARKDIIERWKAKSETSNLLESKRLLKEFEHSNELLLKTALEKVADEFKADPKNEGENVEVKVTVE